MHLDIRHYKPEDYDWVLEWWKASGETAPTQEMLPPQSTFVMEYGEEPILCVTLYLPNSTAFAWVDNFVGKPGMAKSARRLATRSLQFFLEKFARELGYSRLFCISEKPRLQKYYKSLGYRETLRNVKTYIKDLSREEGKEVKPCPQ